jgi:hypothetical protein
MTAQEAVAFLASKRRTILLGGMAMQMLERIKANGQGS